MEKEHVHGVFQSVASQYDAANDRISLGMHHIWKKALVDAALASCPADGVGRVLDVCCGTGDITERIAKGNFIRLKEITLSYDFPKKLIDPLRISALSLRLQATNLCLLYADKKLNGQDPEFMNSGGVASPVPRQFTLTLRLGI